MKKLMSCPWCENKEVKLLGNLGNLLWVRCVACGADHATDKMHLALTKNFKLIYKGPARRDRR